MFHVHISIWKYLINSMSEQNTPKFGLVRCRTFGELISSGTANAKFARKIIGTAPMMNWYSLRRNALVQGSQRCSLSVHRRSLSACSWKIDCIYNYVILSVPKRDILLVNWKSRDARTSTCESDSQFESRKSLKTIAIHWTEKYEKLCGPFLAWYCIIRAVYGNFHKKQTDGARKPISNSLV